MRRGRFQSTSAYSKKISDVSFQTRRKGEAKKRFANAAH
jgi:hypothetical protein